MGQGTAPRGWVWDAPPAPSVLPHRNCPAWVPPGSSPGAGREQGGGGHRSRRDGSPRGFPRERHRDGDGGAERDHRTPEASSSGGAGALPGQMQHLRLRPGASGIYPAAD